MVAARRFTEPCTRITAITLKAKVPAAKNTSNATMVELPSAMNRSIALISASRSDLEVDHAEHDQVADAHPTAGAGKRDLGQALVPDAGVEVRRDHLDHQEHQDRQRR